MKHNFGAGPCILPQDVFKEAAAAVENAWIARYPHPSKIVSNQGPEFGSDVAGASSDALAAKVSDGKPIKAKLPYNAQVTPYLKIESPAGQVIDLRMDNYGPGGPMVRAEYVTREGVQEYENLGWMNGYEVQYTIPAGIKILALKYRETGYDTEFTGTFECDDEFLNRYREKSHHHKQY